MSQLNRPAAGPRTHEGGPSAHIPPSAQLRRAVSCCLLWEDSFYESGKSIAERIRELVNGPHVTAEFVMNLAVEARERLKLRHAPLLLVRELLRHPGPKPGLAQCITRVIQRPDELAELCSLYWADSKKLEANSPAPLPKRAMLPRQLKKGLSLAFQKFSPYQLAKYNRDNAVKLKDVLFMCHAKPKDAQGNTYLICDPIDKPKYKRGKVARSASDQGRLWRDLVEGKLSSPDTWEVALSSGADKRETFERLIREGKLGGLALLRNLRNMLEAGCDTHLVNAAIRSGRGFERVLPYRFIAAAKAAPAFEPSLDQAMQDQLKRMEKLPGRTLILIDGSGSMKDKLSEKSDLTRFDAACGLAILARGLCGDERIGVRGDSHCRVFIFSQTLKEVAPRQGMALRDALRQSAEWSSTYLGGAVKIMNSLPHDRLIVVTDEQSNDPVPPPVARLSYMLNVGGYRPGISSTPKKEVDWSRGWTGIYGWSEASIAFIQELENGVSLGAR